MLSIYKAPGSIPSTQNKYEKRRLKTRNAYRTYDGAKADTAYKDLTGDKEQQYM